MREGFSWNIWNFPSGVGTFYTLIVGVVLFEINIPRIITELSCKGLQVFESEISSRPLIKQHTFLQLYKRTDTQL